MLLTKRSSRLLRTICLAKTTAVAMPAMTRRMKNPTQSGQARTSTTPKASVTAARTAKTAITAEMIFFIMAWG